MKAFKTLDETARQYQVDLVVDSFMKRFDGIRYLPYNYFVEFYAYHYPDESKGLIKLLVPYVVKAMERWDYTFKHSRKILNNEFAFTQMTKQITSYLDRFHLDTEPKLCRYFKKNKKSISQYDCYRLMRLQSSKQFMSTRLSVRDELILRFCQHLNEHDVEVGKE